MAFEIFTQVGIRIKKPAISIYPRNQIRFNSSATRDFSIDKFKYVVLFYDKNNGKLGFKFTNERGDGTHTLVGHQAAFMISCKPFISHCKLQTKKVIHKTITFDKKTELFVA